MGNKKCNLSPILIFALASISFSFCVGSVIDISQYGGSPDDVDCPNDNTGSSKTEPQQSIIKLDHSGWYVARFKVEWDEISYDDAGKAVKDRKGWNRNCQKLTAPFHAEVQITGNVQNISVFAEEATGLAWEPWRTILDRFDIPLIKERAFAIWGTTLNPKFSIEPEI